ncbi:protein JINGUBANG-like [Magnolia sinica]|uniref:protein JINGUBANG-like n=1 Tax=Magnolia sinica TaxID=86752 RepID=UPI00265A6060|nr:protein JINGUBANG-like [Magnolia sinica]
MKHDYWPYGSNIWAIRARGPQLLATQPTIASRNGSKTKYSSPLNLLFIKYPFVSPTLSLPLCHSPNMPASPWFSSCSTAACTSFVTDATIAMPTKRDSPQNNILSDSSSSSEIPTSTDYSSISSLRSNLSLQTLPSIPSLQKSSPEDSSSSSLSYTCLSSFKTHPCYVSSLALSPTANLLYSTSANEIRVWDLSTFSQIEAFNGNGSGSVKSVIFSNGKIFTAHQDSKIRVWQITEPKRQHRLVTSLPTANDVLRRFIFPKNYVRIRRHRKRLWVQHADAVSSLAVSNGLLYSVSWDKSLKIWRESDLRCLESVTAHEDAVNAVAVSVDGTVYTASADSRIRVWGKAFGETKHSLIAALEKHKSSVNALALSADGSVLYSGACDRSILVWEKEDSAHHMVVTGALRGHSKAILCLINVEDLLFSGSADRTVRIWRRGRGNAYGCLAIVQGHERGVKSLVGVWDGKAGAFKICSGSLDGEIKVWQVSGPDIGRSNSSPDLLGWKV